MAVRIRLTRVGARNNPMWRVVAADQRSPRDGRFIEVLGHYNPQTEPVDDRARRAEAARLDREGGAAQRHGQEADEGQGDQRLKELLEFLARTLVDEPAKVEVHEFEEDEETVVLELIVSEDDRGKVIGRHGRTANALRAIMRADGTKEGKRVLVEIVD